MAKYIAKRLAQLAPILFGLTFLVFALLSLSPGDPALKRLSLHGAGVSREELELTRERMGLNRPFLVRYGLWLRDALRGDLGVSYRDGRPVAPKLRGAAGCTAALASASLLLSLLISVPLGILTAVKRGSVPDAAIRCAAFVGNAMPNFLISVLLMYLLCIRVRLFPVIARGSLQGLTLPVLAVAIPLSSRFVRQIRAEVLEQLSCGWVTGMRSRGVRERFILFANVLHNAAGPILTIIGLSVGTLLGGSVVVESIFRWPGLGKLAMDAIRARDYPVIQGFVLLTAVFYVGINLLTDIAYHLLDPRIGLD